MKNALARGNSWERQSGAAIPEFLLTLPVIVVFFVGILQVGRLINQSNYMKVIAYDAAIYGAGISDAAATTGRASDLFDISAANQVSRDTQPFVASYNEDDDTVSVTYNSSLIDLSLPNIAPVSFGGSVTFPVLSTTTGLLDSAPANDGIFSSDGLPVPEVEPPPPPACLVPAYCDRNPPCVRPAGRGGRTGSSYDSGNFGGGGSVLFGAAGFADVSAPPTDFASDIPCFTDEASQAIPRLY